MIGKLLKDCLLSEEVQEEISRGLGLVKDTAAAREVWTSLTTCCVNDCSNHHVLLDYWLKCGFFSLITYCVPMSDVNVATSFSKLSQRVKVCGWRKWIIDIVGIRKVRRTPKFCTSYPSQYGKQIWQLLKTADIASSSLQYQQFCYNDIHLLVSLIQIVDVSSCE